MRNLKHTHARNTFSAKQCGGGGGKPDRAQAGGKLPEQLDAALTGAHILI